MKKLLIVILTFMLFINVSGQTDRNGNPVFNSISRNEKKIDKFLLISNYYTLENNIENSKSSVFISEKPDLDQIENAAIGLPSDFYILTKESKMVVMVMLQNKPERSFLTIVTKTNQQSTYPCKLSGDITENRANEIIKEQYDSNAYIENSTLHFNGKEFEIISNIDIEDAVWTLITKEKLNKKKPSDVLLPSKNEIKNYIISESQKGGTLDYFTEIIGKEYDGVQIKPGVFTTNIGIALYKWGRACFEIGVNTIEDAIEIYSEFKGKSVNVRDETYIKSGFNKDWEK